VWRGIWMKLSLVVAEPMSTRCRSAAVEGFPSVPAVGNFEALTSRQLPIKPSRPIAANLALKVLRGERFDLQAITTLSKVIGLARPTMSFGTFQWSSLIRSNLGLAD
jgi:hypothetical protein